MGFGVMGSGGAQDWRLNHLEKSYGFGH